MTMTLCRLSTAASLIPLVLLLSGCAADSEGRVFSMDAPQIQMKDGQLSVTKPDMVWHKQREEEARKAAYARQAARKKTSTTSYRKPATTSTASVQKKKKSESTTTTVASNTSSSRGPVDTSQRARVAATRTGSEAVSVKLYD